MKEHGILFSAPMVKAILAGQKTQTRRTVEPQPYFAQIHEWKGRTVYDCESRAWCWKGHVFPDALVDCRGTNTLGEMLAQYAPHGPVGRRLYVKETWATSIACDKRKAKDLKHEGWPIWYRADNKVRFLGADTGGPAFMTRGKWRPSIFMPPWASRITLDVTRVRVERVGDISEEDARAEGVGPIPCSCCEKTKGRGCTDGPSGGCCPCCNGTGIEIGAAMVFAHLWDSINGAGSWASSPWVWVYDFRRVG